MGHKLCKILGIKLWETYDKVSEVFTKPQLHFKMGKWRNDACLPVWRHGPIISFGKYSDKYIPNGYNCIKVGVTTMSDGKEAAKYESISHKLPVKNGEYVWKRHIRKKLRKYHLGWFPTSITLPICFAFHIFNWDVMWKTKWDDIRYEYPPQFTIVLFGISFSWWLSAPNASTDWNGQPDNDSYWETILEYVYGEHGQGEKDNPHNLKRCIDHYYFRVEYTDEENKKFDELTAKMKTTDSETPEYDELRKERDSLGIRVNTIACRPEYLQPKYLGVFYNVLSEFKAKYFDKQNWTFR